MNGYKGFDKNLQCRNKQFEIGKTYEEEEAKLCDKGLHFVEYPLDAFGYYPPSDSRYAEIEAEDVTDEKDSDSKRVCKKLTIKGEMSIKGIIDASVKFILEKIDWGNKKETNTGDRSAATNTGDQSAATNTGYRSAATNTGDQSAATNTGDWSAATNTGDQSAATNTGFRSAATVKGKNSVALSMGIEGKASGAIGCWLVLSEWKQNNAGDWYIKTVKTIKVDGKEIKADTFYTLKDGKFIEEAREEIL
jgi:hypothetical protein